MSRARPATSVLRFVTPGQFAICLTLFFLPWIEVQCGLPNLNNLGGAKLGGPNVAPPKISKDDLRYSSLITQSGFQAATGKYTVSNEMMKQMIDEAEQKAKNAGGEKEEVKKAPVLFLFLGASIAGLVLGLALPLGRTRKFLLVLCGGLALASAGTQAAIGFPITEDVKKNPEMGGGNGNDQDLGGLKPEDVIKTVYQIPFFLALLFATAAVVCAFLEPNGTAPARRRRYDDYDDDDAPDDRGFEVVEDGDSDDRPRRRRDRDDRDDDDRPRRKRSRPDDEE